MKLSLTILYENLTAWNPKLISQNGCNTMCYLGAQIMEDDMIPLENHILLIKADSQNEVIAQGKQGILCIGAPTEYILKDNDCIIFPEGTSITKLFADIQRIFLKYAMWSEALFKAANNDADIQELCDLSADIFENPILVYDNNLLLLAIANDMSGLPEWDYDEISGKRTLPLDTLNDFKINEEWQQTMITHGAQMVSELIIGYRVLYYNFWLDDADRYSGRICLNELARKITDGEYGLLEYLGEIINSVLLRSSFHQSDKIKALEQSLIDLIEGTKINELIFVQRLTDFGWNRNDSYLCIQIIIEDRDSKTKTANYTCNRLENNFQHCFVFPYQNKIIMIMNLSKNRKNISDLLLELKIFLREGLFRAGISTVSNDFFNIRESYLQTSLAVAIGEKIDPMYWYYHFSDYVIQAMFYEISKNISVDMFCEPALFELQKYDKEHQTQLYETLKIYLDCNMNIAHTSNKLYIHRSTLMYRLERINSLMNLDMRNPEDRFRILLSYHLLEWNKNLL